MSVYIHLLQQYSYLKINELVDYVVTTDLKQQSVDSPNSDQQFEEFDKFAKRKLARTLERKIAKHLESQPEQVKEFLTKFVAENAPECMEELYHDWRRAQSQVPSTPAISLPEGNMSFISSPAVPSLAGPQSLLRNDALDGRLTSFYVQPPAVSNSTSFPEVSPLKSGVHGPSASSDSAYYSNESIYGQPERNIGSQDTASHDVDCHPSGRMQGPPDIKSFPARQYLASFGDLPSFGGVEYLPQSSGPEQAYNAPVGSSSETPQMSFLMPARDSTEDQAVYEEPLGLNPLEHYGGRAHDEPQDFSDLPYEYHSTHGYDQRVDDRPMQDFEQNSSSPLASNQTCGVPGLIMEGWLALHEGEDGDYESEQRINTAT